ncbi:cell division protein FtsX [Roseivirga pacifica]|uniref:cell division protein FtsX n=1 Tax=Roseivirga pacifica TaxID=1267423 RepID=UPI003BABEF84
MIEKQTLLAADPKKFKKKKKLGSYQYVSVIFSITLALFVIGLFGILVLQAQQLTANIKSNIELQVYLNKEVSQNQINRIETELAGSPYALKLEGEKPTTFISKEEAAKAFIAQTGEDFSEFLGDNPLRDAITLRIAEDYQSNAKLDSLSNRIESISGVYEVTYVENLVDSINSNLTKIGLVLVAIAAILTFVVILLINNTIKLALFSQRFLIRSMQLVGAKSSFIRGPFLKKSFLHGIIAGLIASALLFGLLTFANQKIEGLESLQSQQLMLIVFGVLVIIGGIMAYYSTARAMNKYLKMSLDELY